jgi:predicted transcriptional regulator
MPEDPDLHDNDPPQTQEAGNLLGREFITAVVVFHETVGRLLGLTAVERKCLDVLARIGPVTAGGIAEHTGLTTGAVTGLIDRLQSAGYVERATDPTDRRRVRVSLRPDSRLNQVMPAVFGPLGVDMAALTGRYQPEELLVIADFLRRTTDVLVAHTRRLGQLDPP